MESAQMCTIRSLNYVFGAHVWESAGFCSVFFIIELDRLWIDECYMCGVKNQDIIMHICADIGRTGAKDI